MKSLTLFVIVIAISYAGCSTMKPEDFKGTEPRLILEEYFAGETKAWGIFEDRFGNLKRQFTVDIIGTMEGDELVLDERFFYSDGERAQRIWRIRHPEENVYEGRAVDVIGIAEGKVYGSALNWSYDVDLKVGNGTWRVHFNDWMFLQPGGVLINRAKVTKYGFEIGQVTLSFIKPSGQKD